MSSVLRSNGWGVCSMPRPMASKRLFCFPYAGGCASAFRPWADTVPADIEVWAVQLPGRENRWKELPYTRIESLIPDLAQALEPEMDRPFAFYGHSMGALIAFELTRYLQEQGKTLPTTLFVSGRRAPGLTGSREHIHHLPTAEFKAKIRELNGTPQTVLQNEELMNMLLDMLRADFALAETYAHQAGQPLTCPIVSFAGEDDAIAPPTEVAAWQTETRTDFQYHLLPGGHFFLHSARSQLLQLILGTMQAQSGEKLNGSGPRAKQS